MRLSYLRYLPPGNHGVRMTVADMWRMILSYSPRVRDTAETILREYHVERAFSNDLQSAALFDWVQRHLNYVGDHALIEEIRGTDGLLQEIQDKGSAFADCDDYVILLAALNISIGIPVSLVTVAMRDSADLTHVYLRVFPLYGPHAADSIPVRGAIPFDRAHMLIVHGQRHWKFGFEAPDEAVSFREESPMPASLEEIGVNPMETVGR